MKSVLSTVLFAALAGCASPPATSKSAPERYRDSWIGFDTEAEAMLRAAGRNRLKVEACAGRARSSLDSMRALLGEAPAARLAALGDHFSALSRTIAADNAVSSGQERAVAAVRDEVARDFAPEKVAVISREPEPPQPAPPDALARWEDAHRRFESDARGGETAHLVQDYSELRAAMETFAKSEEDRFRIERFLRDYERIADLTQSGKIPEQDLKGLPVLAADIRAAFGEKK